MLSFLIEWVITVSLKMDVSRLYETPLHVYQIVWYYRSQLPACPSESFIIWFILLLFASAS